MNKIGFFSEIFIKAIADFNPLSYDQNKLSFLLDLIETSYNCNESTKRREAEKTLENIQNSNLGLHLIELFNSIYLYNNETNEKSIEKIIIYTAALLRRTMNLEQINDSNFIIQLIAYNIKCLFKQNLNSKFKIKLAVSLEYLINLCSLLDIKSQMIVMVLEFIENSINENLNLNYVLTKMLIIKVIIHQIFENNLITQMILKIFSNIINNLKFLFINFCQNFGNPNFNYNDHIEIIILITDLISILLQKCNNEIEYRTFLKEFIENTEIHEIFNQILFLNIKNETLCLITNYEDNNLFKSLNNIKFNILHSNNILLQYLNNYEIDNINSDNFIYFNSNLLKFFVDQLKLIFTDIDKNKTKKNLLNDSVQQLLSEITLFLSICVKDLRFFKVFLENNLRLTLCMDVILNSLKNDESEYELAQENPEEFVNLDNDIVETQISNILKTNMSQLLYLVCEKIDGTLLKLSRFLLETLDYIIKANRGENAVNSGNYDVLQNFQNIFFLTNTEDSNIVETILLVFSILTKLIIQREDIVKDVEELFKKYLFQLFKSNSTIIRSRICLMMRSYSSFLFQRNEEYFSEIFKFLFNCLIEANEKIIVIQALETLFIILKKNEIVSKAKTSISHFLPTILKLIKTSRFEGFFDLLAYIIETFSFFIDKYSESIINCLVDRVHLEFELISKKNLKNNLFITKCLEIIRLFVAQEQTMDEFYNCFDKKLEELFGYLEKLNQIDFEELLIDILNEIIAKVHYLVDVYEIIQKYLMPIFEKNNKDIKVFFNTFYNFSYFGHEFIIYNKMELLEQMIEITLISLESHTLENLSYDYLEFSQTCLLLQFYAQFFKEYLISEKYNFVKLILERILIFYVNLQPFKENASIFSSYIRLIQVLLLYTFYYPDLTFNLLTQSNTLSILAIDSIKMYPQAIKYSAYNKKVYFLGTLSLMEHANLKTNDFNYFKIILETLIKTVSSIDKKKNERHKNEMINLDDINNKIFEDDEKDSDLLCSKNNEELSPIINMGLNSNKDKNLEAFFEKHEIPIFLIDEYSLFKELFEKFKNNDSDDLSKVISSLSPEDFINLKDILSTRYIKNEKRPKTLRKIIKVKTHNNT